MFFVNILLKPIYKIIFYIKVKLMKIKYNINIMKSVKFDKETNIWKYTYIWYNTFITKTTIWNYCSIANNVSIGMWEHELSNISTNSIFYENAYEELTKKDCIIWNDVWIWVDSIIRRWVTIWNWAVIWANSFVNKDVPAYSIVVWNPAKVIKYRFNKKQIEKIEKSKWWKKNYKEAKEIINNIKI